MSRDELIIGKLRKVKRINRNETDEEMYKRILSEHSTIKSEPYFYSSYKNQIENDFYEKYKFIGDVLYEIVDAEDRIYDDFCNIRKIDDDTFEFIAKFYNGGGCLSEILREGFLEKEKGLYVRDGFKDKNNYYLEELININKKESEKPKILVFGGTFNPPTIAHDIVAKTALRELNAEKCIFVPVGDKYSRKEGYVSAEHRYNMLTEYIKNEVCLEIDDVEINSKKQLTTYETLKHIQNKYPNHEILFLMGSDNLLDLKTWENYEKLLQEFKFAIIQRKSINDELENINDIIDNDELLKKHKDCLYCFNVPEKICERISSTFVRNLKDKNSASLFLHPYVFDYIQKNKLYFY